jgi:hypothetical protein
MKCDGVAVLVITCNMKCVRTETFSLLRRCVAYVGVLVTDVSGHLIVLSSRIKKFKDLAYVRISGYFTGCFTTFNMKYIRNADAVLV